VFPTEDCSVIAIQLHFYCIVFAVLLQFDRNIPGILRGVLFVQQPEPSIFLPLASARIYDVQVHIVQDVEHTNDSHKGLGTIIPP
jgi:hypothetical protein